MSFESSWHTCPTAQQTDVGIVSLTYKANHCGRLTLHHVFVTASRLSGNCYVPSRSLFVKRPSLGLMRSCNVVFCCVKIHLVWQLISACFLSKSCMRKKGDICGWLVYRESGISNKWRRYYQKLQRLQTWRRLRVKMLPLTQLVTNSLTGISTFKEPGSLVIKMQLASLIL